MNKIITFSVKTQIWMERRGKPLFQGLLVVALGVIATALLTHYKVGCLRKLHEIAPNISKWGAMGGSIGVAVFSAITGVIYCGVDGEISGSLKRMRQALKILESQLKEQNQKVTKLETEYQKALSHCVQDLTDSLFSEDHKVDFVVEASNDRARDAVVQIKSQAGDGKSEMQQQAQEKWDTYCLQDIPMTQQNLEEQLLMERAILKKLDHSKVAVIALTENVSQAKSYRDVANIEIAINNVITNEGFRSDASIEETLRRMASDENT